MFSFLGGAAKYMRMYIKKLQYGELLYECRCPASKIALDMVILQTRSSPTSSSVYRTNTGFLKTFLECMEAREEGIVRK